MFLENIKKIFQHNIEIHAGETSVMHEVLQIRIEPHIPPFNPNNSNTLCPGGYPDEADTVTFEAGGAETLCPLCRDMFSWNPKTKEWIRTSGIFK